MEILIGIIGAALVIWSLTTLTALVRPDPKFVFTFQDGTVAFDVRSPGVYSISVWRAGHISNLSLVNVELKIDDGTPLKVTRNVVRPRIHMDGEMSTGCWYFNTECYGRHELTFTNLEATIAKKSMLRSKRVFENDIEKHLLRVIVHKSIKPLYQFIALLALVVGVHMIMVSFLIDF